MSTIRGVSPGAIRDELEHLHPLVAIGLVLAGLLVSGMETLSAAVSLGMQTTVKAAVTVAILFALAVELARRGEAYMARRANTRPMSSYVRPDVRWSR